MLPEDVKARRRVTVAQPKSADKVIYYSDKICESAILECMVRTNQVRSIVPWFPTASYKTLQPISATDEPSYRHMILVASKAQRRIVIPSGKVCRAAILRLFNKTLLDMKNTFQVCYVLSVIACSK
jgi:hypothetical protein